ncbi:Imm32 family immunity protein [Micromonospora lupini]|uniref:Imm32 family immunity protein n=1 Tax=Micromonospora lupini TaxID=285679 RepID=UPI0033ED30B8
MQLDYYSATEGVDITSDRAADRLRDTATMDGGGHVHLEYVEGHPHQAPGSMPLILNSPRGGMPRR